MNNTEKLLSCPFCGGEAGMIVHTDDDGYRATIHCSNGAEVGCFTKSSHWAKKKSWVIKTAITAWNRRVETQWIPVSERLPEWNERVLTYSEGGQMHENINGGGIVWQYITHWCPLPEPPKEART